MQRSYVWSVCKNKSVCACNCVYALMCDLCAHTIFFSDKKIGCVHKYTTSKYVEVKSPGCSGFKVNLGNSKA